MDLDQGLTQIILVLKFRAVHKLIGNTISGTEDKFGKSLDDVYVTIDQQLISLSSMHFLHPR